MRKKRSPVMATKSNKAEGRVIKESKETTDNVISSGSQRVGPASDMSKGITSVSNGVIGTGVVKKQPVVKKVIEEKTEEKVAVYSTKNVSWPGVGKIQKGYNIVTKEQAESWLSRNHVRAATPEEVAQEFGQ
jgi:hypothetical protein